MTAGPAFLRRWAAVVTRTARKRWVRVPVVVLVGALAGAASLMVAPTVHGELGPGSVSVTAHLSGQGRTEVAVPPLGTISARTHDAPLVVRSQVDVLDTDQLEELTVTGAQRELRSQVEADLPALLLRFAMVTGAWALGAGIIAGGLAPGRRWSNLVAGGFGALVVAGSMAVAVHATMDVDAFEQPRFEGPIAAAPGLFDTLQRHVDGFDDVRGRVATLSDKVAGLYSAATDDPAAGSDGEVVLLHVSDIHLNPVGLTFAQQVAEDFAVDAVLDTGDLTSFGSPLEAGFATLLRDFDVPYLFVAGNHDSAANRAAIDAIDGVELLDGTTVDVAGLRIFGVGDPTFTADNATSGGDLDAAYANQRRNLRSLVVAADADLVALHNPVQVKVIAGSVPAIAVGHRHQTALWKQGTSVIAQSGSSGALGLEAFLEPGVPVYEMQLLRFSQGQLVAVDAITFDGVDGGFTIQRQLVESIAAGPEAGPTSDSTTIDAVVPGAPAYGPGGAQGVRGAASSVPGPTAPRPEGAPHDHTTEP